MTISKHIAKLQVFFRSTSSVVFVITLIFCSATLIFLSSIITLESFLRSFFNYSIDFVHELTGYGVALLTVIGGAISMRERGFFRVKFVFERLPAVLRTVLLWVHVLLSFVFCVGMLFYTVRLVLASWKGANKSLTTLAVPLYIPEIVLPLGFLLFIFFIVGSCLLRNVHPK